MQAFFFIAQIRLGGVLDWKYLFLFLGANFLGAVSWLELPLQCSFLAFPRWKLRKLFASFFLPRDFLFGVSYMGHPGWQFFVFLFLAVKLGKWNFLGGQFAAFLLPLAKCPRWTDPSRSPPCSSLNKELGEVSWVEVPGLGLTDCPRWWNFFGGSPLLHTCFIHKNLLDLRWNSVGGTCLLFRVGNLWWSFLSGSSLCCRFWGGIFRPFR